MSLDNGDLSDDLGAGDDQLLQEDQPEEGDQDEQAQKSQRIWQLSTAIDERVCSMCVARDGEICGEEDLDFLFPDAEQIDEETMSANLHANCRCVISLQETVESEDETLGESDQLSSK